MAYTMTVTPDQLSEAMDAAAKREFERSVDSMMQAVDAKLKETLKELTEGTLSTRVVAFTDDDYIRAIYDAVATRLTDCGFKVEVRDDTAHMQEDSFTLLITG